MHTTQNELMYARTIADKAVPHEWKSHAPMSDEIRHVYRVLRREFGFDRPSAATQIIRALAGTGNASRLDPGMVEALAWKAA